MDFVSESYGRYSSTSKLDIIGPRENGNIIFIWSILKLYARAKQACKKHKCQVFPDFAKGERKNTVEEVHTLMYFFASLQTRHNFGSANHSLQLFIANVGFPMSHVQKPSVVTQA
jgi:hypothetical protein